MKMKNEKTRRQPGLSLNKFRVWIVLVGGIILGCAMTLSYNHTVDLFKYAGYVVWLSHIGTVMIELTFFLGTSVIILSRSVGMAAGWPARATFIFGAGLVLWSNVSSGIMLLDEQWTAVVLGVAVVTCLFLMEAVVSRALFMFRDEQAEASEQEPGGVPDETDGVPVEPVGGRESGTPVPVEPDSVPVEPAGGRESGTPVPVEPDGVPTVPVQDRKSGTPVPVEPDGVPDETAGGRENGTPVPDDPGGVPDTPAAQLYMYHREKGKLPGRVRVSRICGMEERHARRALARVNDAAREEDDREEVA